MEFEMIIAVSIVFVGGLIMGAIGTMLWALCAAEKEREKDD